LLKITVAADFPIKLSANNEGIPAFNRVLNGQN
jgi:hypothetical protein